MRLISYWGTGDTYLLAAFHSAFVAERGPATLIIKAAHGYIADMFDVPWEDDALASNLAVSLHHQQNHPNEGDDLYVHPSFVRTPIKQTRSSSHVAGQAEMYRKILGLSPNAQLSLPQLPMVGSTEEIVIIEHARSWPNTQPAFWQKLIAALPGAWVNNNYCSLEELLTRCAAAKWVIGPQCGVMAILCAGRFPCRKAILTPSIDRNYFDGNVFGDTYPAGYVTNFTGEDFDVEEHKLTDHNHDDVIEAVLNAVNYSRPYDPSPCTTITAPLSPGDFFDRHAVLCVKHDRFSGAKKAAVRRERDRYAEIIHLRLWPAEVGACMSALYQLHAETFDLFEVTLPGVLANESAGHEAHENAIRLNRRRVELKQRIDELCHGPYTETKSYYSRMSII